MKPMDTKNNPSSFSYKSLKHNNSSGFTLLELVVVITIVAILWTLGFVTVSSYFTGARDSVRLTDMNNVYEQLTFSIGANGALPMPDNYRVVTLSGNIITYQWYAGKSVLSAIKYEKWGKDPKDQIYYTYTINQKRSQAQLLGYFEEYDTSKLSYLSPFVEQTYAATTNYLGRRIGVVGKSLGTLVETWTLAPIQDTSTGALEINTTSSGYVVYFNNSITWGGTGGALQTAFVWNSTAYVPTLAEPVVVVTPPALPSNDFSSCTASWQVFTGSTFYPGTATFSGACNEADKIICTGSGIGQVWSMCNVAATDTTNYDSRVAGRQLDQATDGGLFQFARNDGFANNFLPIYPALVAWMWPPIVVSWSIASTNVFTGETASSWYYNNVNNDWRTTQLSTTTNTTGNIWTTSHCATGYHVPTQSEFATALVVLPDTNRASSTNFPNVLKMPLAWDINNSDAWIYSQGQYGFYWSSSPYNGEAYALQFTDSAVTIEHYGRAYGFSIRCIKD